jgi:signal peptidase II
MTNAPGSRNTIIFWTAAASVVALDVITKKLAVRFLHPGIPRRVIGDVARFTLAFNPGAAFSMSVGDKSRFVFGGFALVALVILWWLFRTTRKGDWIRVLALGLAWGGAAGNLIDRFRSPNGVVDFIDIGVGSVRFWTFNVADSAVTVGAITLALVLWREDREKLALAAGEAAMRDEASTGAR